MDRKPFHLRELAVGGVLAAVTVILLYLAVIIPYHNFFFTMLSSLPVVIMYYQAGLRRALLFFITTVILTLFLFPHPRLVPYIIFFGYYGLVKVFSEEKGGWLGAILLKFFSFNLSLLLMFFLSHLFFPSLKPQLSHLWLVALLQPAFLLYDYLFTRLLSFFKSFNI